MARYRSLPFDVEAVQFTGRNHDEIVEFTDGAAHIVGVWIDLVIPTLEGEMSVKPSSWVVRGNEGEYYPIKDSIFRARYVALDNDEGAT